MPDHFETPEPDEAVKLALERIRETTAAGRGSDMEGLEFNEVVVNMGPQHPSTHGVLRLVVTLDVGALAAGGGFVDAPQGELDGLVGGACGELIRHAGGSRRGRRSLCAADDR